MKAELVELIRRNRRIAATDLAAMSGKHKSTISPHLQELLTMGILREAGTGESGAKGGKPRQFLELNPDYACAVGVDASAARLRGGIYDFKGRQVDSLEAAYSDRSVEAAVKSDLARFAGSLLTRARRAGGACLGVGIGFSGHIDSRAGRIYQSRSLGLRDYNLAADLGGRLDAPIVLQNDANAALLGEKWFHLDYSGENNRNIVYFFIDNYFTSVGFGLMLDGKLYEGSQTLAGELSAYSVGMGVGPDLIEAMRACGPEDLAFLEGTDLKEGMDGSCARAPLRMFDIYATCLVYVIELLNPELLVIGGNFDPHYEFFLEPFAAYTRGRLASACEDYIRCDVRVSNMTYPPVCAGATVPLFKALIHDL